MKKLPTINAVATWFGIEANRGGFTMQVNADYKKNVRVHFNDSQLAYLIQELAKHMTRRQAEVNRMRVEFDNAAKRTT